jgi:O-acetyl-ADP-ribose deacetylase (regulator of RNase III)
MTTFVDRDGDLLDDDADVLVNAVNTQGVMGAGIAARFKARWPAMYEDYRVDCENGWLKPGQIHAWSWDDSPIIVNLPTKVDWRSRSDLALVGVGLAALREYIGANLERVHSIAVPALGCGLGGLDWPPVRDLIESALQGFDALEVRLYPPQDRQVT